MTSKGWVFVAAVAAITVGCKKEKGAASSATPSAYERVDTAPLWKLVPADAEGAIVISDGTLAHSQRAVIQFMADFGKTAQGAKVLSEITPEALKFKDVFLTAGGEDKVGADLKKGGAAYLVGKKEFVIVLPIADPAKLLAFGEGKKDGDFDVYKDNAFCKPIEGYYACASSKELLASLGGGGGMKPPEGELRGHIELLVGERLMAEAKLPRPAITGVKSLRVAATFEPGGATVRATLAGAVPAKFQTSGPPRLLADVAGKSPTGLASLRLSGVLQELTAAIPPDVLGKPGPGGVTGRELIAALDGDIAGYGLPGAPAGVVRVGITKAEPFEKLLSLCGLVPPELGTAKLENNRCTFDIKPPGFMSIKGAVWVADNAVHLGLGDFESKRDDAPALARMGKEIIDGSHIFATWGMGGLYSIDVSPLLQLPEFAEASKALENPEPQLGLWALLHLSEIGGAMSADQSGVHFVARLRTTWSNPTEVVSELEPIFNRISRGELAAVAEVRALAAKHPNSPLAADIKGGGGPMAPAAIVGGLAAVAIPAFTKYVKRSKSSEAIVFLKMAAAGARAFAMDQGAEAALSFPKESTPMSPPAGSCCGQPDGKCQPDAALWAHPSWVALSFSVDAPHYYSYQYEAGADGKTFTVRAVGDLDCDGEIARFEIKGEIANGQAMVSPNIFRESETE